MSALLFVLPIIKHFIQFIVVEASNLDGRRLRFGVYTNFAHLNI